MSKRRIVGTASDPTLPKTPIEIGGKTYELCFDLGALAEAEAAINRELAARGDGRRVNLLKALPFDDLFSTRIVFAAALRTFHPEIKFEDAQNLLQLPDLYIAWQKIREAWDVAQPESEGADQRPTEAAADAVSAK